MPFGPGNNGVEEDDYEDGNREGGVPSVADGAADAECMSEDGIDDCDNDNVEPDDDQSADGYICDGFQTDGIEQLAEPEHTEHETDVCWVEQGDMQDVPSCIESFQMPDKQQDTGGQT